MSSFEQIIRIILHLTAGAVLGDALANSAEVQGLIGGVIAILNFLWWYFANRRKQM